MMFDVYTVTSSGSDCFSGLRKDYPWKLLLAASIITWLI